MPLMSDRMHLSNSFILLHCPRPHFSNISVRKVHMGWKKFGVCGSAGHFNSPSVGRLRDVLTYPAVIQMPFGGPFVSWRSNSQVTVRDTWQGFQPPSITLDSIMAVIPRAVQCCAIEGGTADV
jgi:hypothetical protein